MQNIAHLTAAQAKELELLYPKKDPFEQLTTGQVSAEFGNCKAFWEQRRPSEKNKTPNRGPAFTKRGVGRTSKIFYRRCDVESWLEQHKTK